MGRHLCPVQQDGSQVVVARSATSLCSAVPCAEERPPAHPALRPRWRSGATRT